MIGIECEYISSYERILYDLLKNIKYDEYDWRFVQQEIYFDVDKNRKVPYILSGVDFEKMIKSEDKYYCFFVNLQAYPSHQEQAEIKTYSDFVKSKCELIVLLSDNSFIEVYAKSSFLLQQIIDNIESKNISYQIKTIDNDGRTSMYV